MIAKDATQGDGSVGSGSLEHDTATKGFASALPVAEQQRPKVQEGGTFEATEDVRYYKPISTYEGIHRWDPEFEWTEEEEKKIVRKVPIPDSENLEIQSMNVDSFRLTYVYARSPVLRSLHSSSTEEMSFKLLRTIC